MYIVLPKLSNLTTQADLLIFTSSVLARKFTLPFMQRPTLHSCMIIEITDEAGNVEHHGKLCIDPDKAGKWFIRKIKFKQLHHRHLIAREYVTRTRDEKTLAMSLENERRRENLKIERVKDAKAPAFIAVVVDENPKETKGKAQG